MSSRQQILEAIRSALADRPEAAPLPESPAQAPFPDPKAVFLERLHAADGTGEVAGESEAVVRAVRALVEGNPAPRILVEEDARMRSLGLAERLRAALPAARVELRLDPADPACDLAVTGADYAVAETGTLVQVSSPSRSRLASLVPWAHLAVVPVEALRSGLGEVLSEIEAGGPTGAAVTCITGPSRTADIEQVLTVGVHGPGRLHVILWEGRV